MADATTYPSPPAGPDPRAKNKRAQAVLADFDREKADRSNFDTYCSDVADHVLPRFGGTFTTSRNTNKYDRRDDKILDATPGMGLDRFAASVEMMVTPRTGRWQRLRASDPSLMRSLRVKQYFGDVEDVLWFHRNSAKANFASQTHAGYISLGAFGNAPIFIDEPPEPGQVGLRYKAEHIGNVYFCENAVGIIDTLYRQIFLTASQAAGKFGKDNLPAAIAKELDKPDGSRDKTKVFEFVHCVRPRNTGYGDPPPSSLARYPFVSIYASREDEMIVKEGGYYTFPMPTMRYLTAPGEKMGRSVAMMALPAIKTLYEQKRTALKAGHNAVSPTLLAHDDGLLDGFNRKPDAINYGALTADGRPLIQPLLTGSNFQPVMELMQLERNDINGIFLVTLFQTIVEGPTMTATEVIARTQEKGAMMAPTMGRLQNEFLGPMTERELDILGRQGLLPPMPPELLEAEGEFEIEYDSPLAKAMRTEDAGGTMRYFEIAGMHAQLTGDPSMLDVIDPDIAGPDLAWVLNVPAKYQRTPEAIAKKREERAQAQQTQTAIEAAPAAASLMKTMQQPGSKRAR